MKRSIFVVLVLMAAVAAYGNDGSVRLMNFDAQHFAGPMCFPGDPCGWHRGLNGVFPQSAWNVEKLNGPMCMPGDPCGWPGVIQGLLNGPVCYPGDPCGPQPIKVENQLTGSKFNGPVCYPGDPCGPGGTQ
jgi:hypothetical protein